jgi:limonene-1,2-epoxide hydrolase
LAFRRHTGFSVRGVAVGGVGPRICKSLEKRAIFYWRVVGTASTRARYPEFPTVAGTDSAKGFTAFLLLNLIENEFLVFALGTTAGRLGFCERSRPRVRIGTLRLARQEG